MKQFLKSTAVFACIALMFCACSKDDTEDLNVSSAIEVTGLTQLLPGDSRVWVKWVVPEDESIKTCNVSWTNTAGTAAGTAQFGVVTGWMEHVMNNVPSGNYTFYFQNFNSKGIGSNILTKEVYVYDENTYLEYPSIASMYADDSGVTIEWNEAPEDCLGVKITYTNTNNVTFTTLLTSVEESTLLSDAQVNTTFTFVTYFLPENGLDIIELPNNDSETYQFPDTAPSTPSEISIRPGNDRFKVYWYVPRISEITSTVIVYAQGNAIADTVRVTSLNDGPLIKGGNNELVISKTAIGDSHCEYEGSSIEVVNGKVSAGEYTVTIYNEKALTGTVSDSVVELVEVYDSNTYTYDPKWVGYGEEVASGLLYTGENATIEWDINTTIDDCLGAVASFTDAQGNAQVSDLTVLTSLLTMKNVAYPYTTDANGDDVYDENTTFTYSTYYCPTSGLDTMAVAHGKDEIIPTRSSATPINVSIRPGNNLISVEFDLENDDSIAEVVISYSDGTTTFEDEIIEAKNLNIGSENAYTLSGDNIQAGSTYSVSLVTRNDVGRTSGIVLVENLNVYDFASFEASAIPPAVGEYSFDDSSIALTLTWDVSDDIQDATMEFTYVYDPYDNKTKTIEITNFDAPLVLTDAQPGQPYSYVVTFVPAENAIDTIPFPAITGEFDDIDLSGVRNYMWYEFSQGYNDQDGITYAGNELFRSYSGSTTNRGTMYYPDFGTWTPVYLSEDTTAEQIANIVFPGDYISCDNYSASNYWHTRRLLDESMNQRYSTGTATYEWRTHEYYTESNTEGVYKLYGVPNGGITIDLSSQADSDKKYAYKLSYIRVWRWPNTSADNAYWSCNNIKTFSLYGTNDPNPAANSLLTAVNDDGTPDMTHWDLLLDNVELVRPTEAFVDPSSPYYQDLDYLDCNGDGVVDDSDDWNSSSTFAIPTDMFCNGWRFDIPNDADIPPTRYVRLILHSDANDSSDIENFIINELEFGHRGYTLETKAVM